MRVYDPKKHKLGPDWLVTLKIDGVQAIRKDGTWTSRAGKPLYNLPPVLTDGTYEVFKDDWNTSVSMVRTMNGTLIGTSCLYRIDPGFVDTRLVFNYPDQTMMLDVTECFKKALEWGYEGLVLHGPDGTMLKVKDKVTYDVPVIDMQWGTGKFDGMMGALVTPMGKVGTGFKEKDRDWWAGVAYVELCNRNLNGLPYDPSQEYPYIIEVECMELTPDGKFRHPRFVRIREDKA